MTDTHAHPQTSIDQQLALRTAATRLAEKFTGVYGTETIERFLHTSYDQFATAGSIPHYLPLLAERFARQRLQALARVEGHHRDGRPVALFLCTHNAGRSQMALGFFTHLAGDNAVAWSGGSEPGAEVNPAAIAAMAERGIDIAAEFPKPWTDEVIRAADVVITMGCGDACPVFPGTRYENWDLATPPDATSPTSGRSAMTSNAASGASSTTSTSPTRHDGPDPHHQRPRIDGSAREHPHHP